MLSPGNDEQTGPTMMNCHDSQRQRTIAVGQLASGVAHDFNNVLQVISVCASLIQANPDNGMMVRRYVTRIIEAAERGSAISGRLLNFARLDVEPQGGLDVRHVLENIHDLVMHFLPSNISLSVSSEDEMPDVFINKAEFETVLVNLITNARDAMPDGGEMQISAHCLCVPAANHLELKPGHYIRVMVADNGVGIDAGTIARVMEPFFTTKPKGAGTGLGLSMAREFAERSGGALDIVSRVGVATEVHVWLPCDQRNPSP